jgi:endonuclease/exonuclease/phosphatase family metal-dependent hydrolase
MIDVVSVHLDFSRKSVRKEQLKVMRDTLLKRNHPMIVMGDFNSQWIADQLIQKDTGDTVSLHTVFDRGKNLDTYKNKRLDWILVSKVFSIEAYEVSPHRLSDHLAVVAKIRLVSGTATRNSAEKKSGSFTRQTKGVPMDVSGFTKSVQV